MENEEIVRLIQEGKDVNENYILLYNQNIGLIKSICQPLTEYCEMEDLLQEAFFGMVDAVEHFDSSLGNKFSTYAVYRIKMHCNRYVQDKSKTRRIPVYLQEEVSKYKRYFIDHDGQVDAAAVKKELKLTQKRYEQILQLVMNEECVSLDSIVKENESDSLLLSEIIPGSADIESDVIQGILSGEVWKSLDSLDNRLKDIILMRYKEEMTSNQVAAELGISRQRVSQLEQKALQQLQQIRNVQSLAEAYNINVSDELILLAEKKEAEEPQKPKNYNIGQKVSDCQLKYMFERIETLCKENKISRRKMEHESGLGAGTTSKWKKGKGHAPRYETLQKIADFFGVAVDYLLNVS